MALPNNPTQSEVVKAIKDLENAPAQATDVQVNGTSITSGGVANIVTESAYNASTNKIATKNDIPTKTSDLTNDSGFLTAAPTNMVTTDTAQTVSGTKTLTGGLKVSGRSVGGGDDEGIVVGVAANNYAGVCCGSPSGRRAVFYLKPSATSGNSVWRYNNGSTTYDIAHPEKAGTIALTSDIPTSYVSSVNGQTGAVTVNGMPFTMTLVASSTNNIGFTFNNMVSQDKMSRFETYLIMPNGHKEKGFQYKSSPTNTFSSTYYESGVVIGQLLMSSDNYYMYKNQVGEAGGQPIAGVRYCNIYRLTGGGMA